MAWCPRATIHYLGQCWPRTMSPYGVTGPQWVNGYDKWKRSLTNENEFGIGSPPQLLTHDDVIKWKHFPRNWPFVRKIHRSPVNFPHKGQWRGALMFSLIYVWINDWANNREAGDLRRQHGHYDVIVMHEQLTLWSTRWFLSTTRFKVINRNNCGCLQSRLYSGQKTAFANLHGLYFAILATDHLIRTKQPIRRSRASRFH